MHLTWPYVNHFRTKNGQTKLNRKRSKAKTKPKQMHKKSKIKTTKWQQHQLQFRFNRTFSRKKNQTHTHIQPVEQAHTVRVFHPPSQYNGRTHICRSALKIQCLCVCLCSSRCYVAQCHSQKNFPGVSTSFLMPH